MSEGWATVTLGNVLTKSYDWVELKPEEIYSEVTIRLWGKGVTLRRTALGSEIGSPRRLRVHTNQFILSRIDARNGASGLVPGFLEGAVVSNDFPVFTPNPDLISPFFLNWLAKTPSFVDLCKAASEGTTNRVRLKEERFLALPITLPPLAEQRRIVAQIEELAAKFGEAKGLRRQAVKEAGLLPHAALREVLGQAESQGWASFPLSNVAEVNPARKGLITTEDDTPVSFVPMAAVDDVTGTISHSLIKQIHEVRTGYTFFRNGDVLFARITPCMQNGKAALAADLLNDIGFGSTEFHILRPGPQVLGTWLRQLVRHIDFRRDAAQHFTGTAGQQRVPQAFLKHRMIVVPPLKEQERIVAYLDGLQAQTDALKALQAQSATELDALLPSILAKAFRGDL